jgi:acetyl-CoA carboxylase biotin carboxyl carrier protein
VNIDLDQIRTLLQVVSQTDVVELTIEVGEEKVTIKKSPVVVASSVTLSTPAAPQMVPSPPVAGEISFEPKSESHQVKSEGSVSADLVPVTSPMVGTFYRSSSPTTQPFVQIGDRITVGQTVCIIEAMKLMNDMPSEVSGRIMKVCVDNGSTVEYGQQLFLVDPKG